MRRWLARLSFSLVIVGAVLLFEAFRSRPGAWGAPMITTQRRYAYAAGGALCLAVGMAGVRERHRRSDDDSNGP